MLAGDVGGLEQRHAEALEPGTSERIAEFDEQLTAQASVVSHTRLVEHGDRSLDLHGRCGLGRLTPGQRCRASVPTDGGERIGSRAGLGEVSAELLGHVVDMSPADASSAAAAAACSSARWAALRSSYTATRTRACGNWRCIGGSSISRSTPAETASPAASATSSADHPRVRRSCSNDTTRPNTEATSISWRAGADSRSTRAVTTS